MKSCLRCLRGKRTQAEIAERAGIHETYVSHMERRGLVPTYDACLRLAEAYGVADVEILVRMGYFPHMSEEESANLLAHWRLSQLEPELREVLLREELLPEEVDDAVACFVASTQI